MGTSSSQLEACPQTVHPLDLTPSPLQLRKLKVLVPARDMVIFRSSLRLRKEHQMYLVLVEQCGEVIETIEPPDVDKHSKDSLCCVSSGVTQRPVDLELTPLSKGSQRTSLMKSKAVFTVPLQTESLLSPLSIHFYLLTTPESFYAHMQCLLGFRTLYQFYGYFPISPQCIWVNVKGEVKVWLGAKVSGYKFGLCDDEQWRQMWTDRLSLEVSQQADMSNNFGQRLWTQRKPSKTEFSHNRFKTQPGIKPNLAADIPAVPLINSPRGSAVLEQTIMIKQIFNLIANYSQPLPEQFAAQFNKKSERLTFQQCIQKLKRYIRTRQIQLPTRLFFVPTSPQSQQLLQDQNQTPTIPFGVQTPIHREFDFQQQISKSSSKKTIPRNFYLPQTEIKSSKHARNQSDHSLPNTPVLSKQLLEARQQPIYSIQYQSQGSYSKVSEMLNAQKEPNTRKALNIPKTSNKPTQLYALQKPNTYKEPFTPKQSQIPQQIQMPKLLNTPKNFLQIQTQKRNQKNFQMTPQFINSQKSSKPLNSDSSLFGGKISLAQPKLKHKKKANRHIGEQPALSDRNMGTIQTFGTQKNYNSTLQSKNPFSYENLYNTNTKQLERETKKQLKGNLSSKQIINHGSKNGFTFGHIEQRNTHTNSTRFVDISHPQRNLQNDSALRRHDNLPNEYIIGHTAKTLNPYEFNRTIRVMSHQPSIADIQFQSGQHLQQRMDEQQPAISLATFQGTHYYVKDSQRELIIVQNRQSHRRVQSKESNDSDLKQSQSRKLIPSSFLAQKCEYVQGPTLQHQNQYEGRKLACQRVQLSYCHQQQRSSAIQLNTNQHAYLKKFNFPPLPRPASERWRLQQERYLDKTFESQGKTCSKGNGDNFSSQKQMAGLAANNDSRRCG